MSRPFHIFASALALVSLLATPAFAQEKGALPLRQAPSASPLWKGSEISFLPGVGPGARSQTLLLTRGGRLDLSNWFSLGFETSLGYQLTGMPSHTGSWASSMGGVVPRLGHRFGPVHLDVGAMLGLGAMLRTVQIASVPDVVQLRGFWVAEPRVELGLQGAGLAGSLFGGYMFSPNPADLGGVVVGVDLRFRSFPSIRGAVGPRP